MGSLRRLTILAMALAISSRGDTLRLRNGSTVNGSFLGGSADDIRFSVNDDIRHYARSEVVEIIFSPSMAPAGRSEGPIDLGPDIAGVPYLRGASGYLPLERQIGMMSRGGGGVYGMGGGTVYRIQGSRSPVRVRQGDRLVFVVRVNGGGDVRQFQLFRLESRMGYRQTQVTMGGNPPAIPMSINRVSDSIYELTPARGLYPGEYAVSPASSNESYCFGIDY